VDELDVLPRKMKRPKSPPDKTELKRIFRAAHEFGVAGDDLSKPVAKLIGDPPMMLPSMVHTMFSLELYMKCLLGLEGKRAHGHNPEPLFSQLPKPTQILLITRHVASLKSDPNSPVIAACAEGGWPTDLPSLLKRATGFYTCLRYIWESKPQDGSGFLLTTFLHEVRFLILENEPDWIAIYDSRPGWKPT
jgi:hypothetical protein